MAASQSAPTARPEEGRSFVDRVVDAIDRLPFGGWWIYPLIAVAAGVWVTIVRWMTGVAAVGQVDLGVLTFIPYGVYVLALMRYLDRVADRSVDAFAPAIGGTAEELEAWRHRLTTLPRRPAAAAMAAGLLLGAVVVVGGPPDVSLLFAQDLLSTVVLVGWIAILNIASNVLLLYHTWHQLRAVDAIHAAAKHIDPFRSVPLFTFSRLTALTGLGYLVILYYSVTINAELSGAAITTLVIEVLFAVAALACFVLPLVGMHRRLSAAKDSLVTDAEARMVLVRDELYHRIDAGQLTKMDELSDAITGLESVKQVADRVPTWPWTASLFRGFVTALLLPIGIWLITRLLANVLPI